MDTTPKVSEFLKGTKQLFINGKWVDAAEGKTFEVKNPANDEYLASASEAGAQDVDAAVHAAREAFDNGPWSKMSAADRSRLIYKLADLMEENKEELAQLDTLDNGKPIAETTTADVPLAIEHFRSEERRVGKKCRSRWWEGR